jgi:hypothetical protein
MRADTSLRAPKAPRGLIISTGEDVPAGTSLRARMAVVPVAPDAVDWDVLTACQADAAGGVYAAATAGFVRWLASRYAETQSAFPASVARLRALVGATHPRTADVIGQLAAGAEVFLTFAEEVGVVEKEKRSALSARLWEALLALGTGQAGVQEAADPVARYLSALAAALVMGEAHVATVKGEEPERPAAWGWRKPFGSWEAVGKLIGWVDRDHLYLEPEAAFAVAQTVAQKGGDPLRFSRQAVQQRLLDAGLLRSNHDGRTTARRELAGRRRRVLHLDADVLGEMVRAEALQAGSLGFVE